MYKYKGKPTLGPATRRRIILLCIALLLSVSGGCASDPAGRLQLVPDGPDAGAYRMEGERWIYEEDGVVMKAGPYDAGAEGDGDPLVQDLLDRGFVLLLLGIENSADGKVIYNPSLTSLMDSSLGYGKPVDFTELYEMFLDGEESGMLDGYGKRFYDLSVTVRPGQRTERILVFRPLESKAKRAELVIKNVYAGDEIIDVRFPFVIRPEDEDDRRQ